MNATLTPPPPVSANPPTAAGALASRLSPPFRLPGEHFAAALAFWVLGAVGLVWVAPELVRGGFASPRVVAVAHLFTLGWITTTIQGALYQFLPVALSEPIRSMRLAHLSFVLYAPGLALFIAGLALQRSEIFLPGALLFGAALLFFAGNLAATLWRAPVRPLTWWALAGATLFLVATVVLGISLSGNLRWGYLGAERWVAMGVHMHVAVAGWVMLVVVGVAHRLLPMFLLSHGAPEWPGALAVGLLASGAGVLLALHHNLTPGLTWVVAALLGGGMIAFLAQATLFYQHRKKPSLDPGLRLAGLGLLFLAAALCLAPFFLHAGIAAPRVATAYVLVLVLGGLSLFVAGHYYKILPFLVWFHRFGPLVGKRPVPRVSDLYAAGPASAAVVLLGGGTFALAAATLLGAEAAARPAALLFAAGALIVAAQMWTISRRRPT